MGRGGRGGAAEAARGLAGAGRPSPQRWSGVQPMCSWLSALPISTRGPNDVCSHQHKAMSQGAPRGSNMYVVLLQVRSAPLPHCLGFGAQAHSSVVHRCRPACGHVCRGAYKYVLKRAHASTYVRRRAARIRTYARTCARTSLRTHAGCSRARQAISQGDAVPDT